MVMSSKWAQALSSWYMVGPEPMSMRVRPDTSPGPGRGRGSQCQACLNGPLPQLLLPYLHVSSPPLLPGPRLPSPSVCLYLEKHWFWSRTNWSLSPGVNIYKHLGKGI